MHRVNNKGLVPGNAPLRGRASFEFTVHTLDHRLAAQLWGISDPHPELKVHAIVGGTLAYRREFVRDAPNSQLSSTVDVLRNAIPRPDCGISR